MAPRNTPVPGPDAAETAIAAGKAQKVLAAAVKLAKDTFSSEVAAGRVSRDTFIAQAYAAFGADPTAANQKTLTAAVRQANTEQKATATASRVTRDTAIAQAYAAFAAATGSAPGAGLLANLAGG